MFAHILKFPVWILVIISISSFAFSDDRFDGKITDVRGKAWLVQENRVKKEALEGMYVRSGEVLQTGKGGFIRVEFFDGSTLSMVGDSELDVRLVSFDPKNPAARLDLASKRGILQFDGNRENPSHLTMELPNTTVNVQGSHFVAEVKPGKTSCHGEGVSFSAPKRNIADLLSWGDHKTAEETLKILAAEKSTPMFMGPDGSLQIVYTSSAAGETVVSNFHADGSVDQKQVSSSSNEIFKGHVRNAMGGKIPSDIENKITWVKRELPTGALSAYNKEVQDQGALVKASAQKTLKSYEAGDYASVIEFSKGFIKASSKVNTSALGLDRDLLDSLPAGEIKVAKMNALEEKKGLNYKAYSERGDLITKLTMSDSKESRTELVSSMKVLNLEVKRWNADIQSREIDREIAYFESVGDAKRVQVLSKEEHRLLKSRDAFTRKIQKGERNLSKDALAVLDNPDSLATKNLLNRDQQNRQVQNALNEGNKQIPTARALLEQAHDQGLAFGKGRGTRQTENGIVHGDTYHFFSKDDLDKHMNSLGGLKPTTSTNLALLASLATGGATSGELTAPPELVAFIQSQDQDFNLKGIIAQVKNLQANNTRLASKQYVATSSLTEQGIQAIFTDMATQYGIIADNLKFLSDVSTNDNVSDVLSDYTAFGKALIQIQGTDLSSLNKNGPSAKTTVSEFAILTTLNSFAQDLVSAITNVTNDYEILPPYAVSTLSNRNNVVGYLEDVIKQQADLASHTLTGNARILQSLGEIAAHHFLGGEGAAIQSKFTQFEEMLLNIGCVADNLWNKYAVSENHENLIPVTGCPTFEITVNGTTSSVNWSTIKSDEITQVIDHIVSSTPGVLTVTNESGKEISAPQNVNIADLQRVYGQGIALLDEQISDLDPSSKEAEIALLNNFRETFKNVLIPSLSSVNREFRVMREANKYREFVHVDSEHPIAGAVAFIIDEGLTLDAVATETFDWNDIGFIDVNNPQTVNGSSNQGSANGSSQTICTDSLTSHTGSPLATITATGRRRYFSCPSSGYSGNCAKGSEFSALNTSETLSTYSRFELNYPEVISTPVSGGSPTLSAGTGSFLGNVSIYDASSESGMNLSQNTFAVGHQVPSSLTRVYYPFKMGNNFLTLTGSFDGIRTPITNPSGNPVVSLANPSLSVGHAYSNIAIYSASNGKDFQSFYPLSNLESSESAFYGTQEALPSSLALNLSNSNESQAELNLTAHLTGHFYNEGPSPTSQEFDSSENYTLSVVGPYFTSHNSSHNNVALAGSSFGFASLKKSSTSNEMEISDFNMFAVEPASGKSKILGFTMAPSARSSVQFDTENFIFPLGTGGNVPSGSTSNLTLGKSFFPESNSEMQHMGTLPNKDVSFFRGSSQFLVYDPGINVLRPAINTLVWGTSNIVSDNGGILKGSKTNMGIPGMHTFFVGGVEGAFPVVENNVVSKEQLVTMGVFKGGTFSKLSGTKVTQNEGLLGMRQDYKAVQLPGSTDEYCPISVLGIFSGYENTLNFSAVQNEDLEVDSILYFKGYVNDKHQLVNPVWDASSETFSNDISVASLIPDSSTVNNPFALASTGNEAGAYKIFSMPLKPAEGNALPDGLIFSGISGLGLTGTDKKVANLVGAAGMITPLETPFQTDPNGLAFMGTCHGFTFDASGATALGNAFLSNEYMTDINPTFANGSLYDFITYPTEGALRIETVEKNGSYTTPLYQSNQFTWPEKFQVEVSNTVPSSQDLPSVDLAISNAAALKNWTMNINTNSKPTLSLPGTFEFTNLNINLNAAQSNIEKTNAAYSTIDFKMSDLSFSSFPNQANVSSTTLNTSLASAIQKDGQFTLYSIGGKVLAGGAISVMNDALSGITVPAGQTTAATVLNPGTKDASEAYAIYTLKTVNGETTAEFFTPDTTPWYGMNATMLKQNLTDLYAPIASSDAVYNLYSLELDYSDGGATVAKSPIFTSDSSLQSLLDKILSEEIKIAADVGSHPSRPTQFAIFKNGSANTTPASDAYLQFSGDSEEVVKFADQIANGTFALCEVGDGSSLYNLKEGTLSAIQSVIDPLKAGGGIGITYNMQVTQLGDVTFNSYTNSEGQKVIESVAFFNNTADASSPKSIATLGDVNDIITGLLKDIGSDAMTVESNPVYISMSYSETSVLGASEKQIPIVGAIQNINAIGGSNTPPLGSFSNNVVDPVWISKDLFFFPSVGNLKGMMNLPTKTLGDNIVFQSMPGVEQFQDVSWGIWRSADVPDHVLKSGFGYFAFGKKENMSSASDYSKLISVLSGAAISNQGIAKYFGHSIGTIYAEDHTAPINLTGSAMVVFDTDTAKISEGQIILQNNKNPSAVTSVVLNISPSDVKEVQPGSLLFAVGDLELGGTNYTLSGTSITNATGTGAYSGAFYNKVNTDGGDYSPMKQFAGSFETKLSSTSTGAKDHLLTGAFVSERPNVDTE